MVKIRLTRTGKRNEPHYRIVASDSRVKRDGKYLEKIGYYNPRTKPPTLEFDKDLLQKWLDNGAQMTDTVHDIFVREGVVKKSPKREARIKSMIEASKKRASEDQTDKSEETTPKPSEVKPEEKESEKEEGGKPPEETASEEPAPEKPAEKTTQKEESGEDSKEKDAPEGEPKKEKETATTDKDE